jgi:hypothetical protein
MRRSTMKKLARHLRARDGQRKSRPRGSLGHLVFATGDASISAAMRNGGITQIHHVDHETSSFLGVYAKYITIVYGE